MTTDKVIDASALAAITFVEPDFAAVKSRIHQCLLHAPALLPFEMANVCAKKIRAVPLERDRILSPYVRSFTLTVRPHEVDQREVVALAQQLKLSAYDASYLWLARHLKCELVTLDTKLETAARMV